MATQPTELYTTVNPDESPLDADGFIGVDPIYQNAANKVDVPLAADEDGEAKAKEAEGSTGGDEPKDDGSKAPKTPESPAKADASTAKKS